MNLRQKILTTENNKKTSIHYTEDDDRICISSLNVRRDWKEEEVQ